MKKLSILITQYKEDENVVKNLLNSIKSQINIDFQNDIEIIIVNDGSDVILSDDFLNEYKLPIQYIKNKTNLGLSATRNIALDHASGEYVTFCDCDDMYLMNNAFMLIFNLMNKTNFDFLICDIIEELPVKRKKDDKILYYIYQRMEHNNIIFCHGKFVKRQFLLDNNIRWIDELHNHEAGYFWLMCKAFCKRYERLHEPIYLWKWRENSASRSEKKVYHQKNLKNNLICHEHFIKRLFQANLTAQAIFEIYFILYQMYYELFSNFYLTEEGKKYKEEIEKMIHNFLLEYKNILDIIPYEKKKEMCQQVQINLYKDRNYLISTTILMNNVITKNITFNDWIKLMESLQV